MSSPTDHSHQNTAASTLFPTDFGVCGLAWNDTGLTAFQLPEATEMRTTHSLRTKSKSDTPVVAPAWVQKVIERVQQHLSGHPDDFSDVPIDWSQVSDFQRAVYEHALTIKPGYKRSYGEIARALTLEPGGARAVGTALGTNPWPLIVPCHRVVSADDRMTGFSGPGGIRTKTRLLALEGAELLSE
jgi:methylated-DNA-[protein]-cysteine S-methyltransferase